MPGVNSGGDKTVVLPVRCRRVALSDGDTAEARSVHCPVAAQPRTLEHCLDCPLLVRQVEVAAQEALECSIPAGVRLRTETCDEALGPDSLCLDGDLAVSTALRLLNDANLTAAPVVDDRGIFIGCARIEALRQAHEDDKALALRRPDVVPQVVDDALLPPVARVRPDAPLQEAARLMTRHQLSQLPVIDADGQVVGVLTPMDLVRWLADAGDEQS